VAGVVSGIAIAIGLYNAVAAVKAAMDAAQVTTLWGLVAAYAAQAAAMIVAIAPYVLIVAAIAAVIAIIHDLLIMCAMYGLFQFAINSPFIAALLTIMSYSINDTIVCFDRIRENSADSGRGLITTETINESITQVLDRSIITSLTTAVAIIPLIIMGGETMNNFTIPLLIGILAGTYSSIFLASPVLSELSERQLKKIEEKKKEHQKSKYQGAKKKTAQ
jgi:preprotein translocase SecF subunit